MDFSSENKTKEMKSNSSEDRMYNRTHNTSRYSSNRNSNSQEDKPTTTRYNDTNTSKYERSNSQEDKPTTTRHNPTTTNSNNNRHNSSKKKVLSRTELLALKEAESKRNKEPLDLETINEIIISRDYLLENIYKPHFESIVGSYVRVCLEESYYIGKIIGIAIGSKAYSSIFEGRKEVKTNRYLKIMIGKKVYDKFEVTYVSNSKVKELEFNIFKGDFKGRVISKGEFLIPYFDIKKKMERVMSDLEFTKMLEEKHKFHPREKSMTVKKIELITQRDNAINGDKDYKKAAKYQQMIIELEDEQFKDNPGYKKMVVKRKQMEKLKKEGKIKVGDKGVNDKEEGGVSKEDKEVVYVSIEGFPKCIKKAVYLDKKRSEK